MVHSFALRITASGIGLQPAWPNLSTRRHVTLVFGGCACLKLSDKDHPQITPITQTAWAGLLLQADGRIVVAGQANTNQIGLARYMP